MIIPNSLLPLKNSLCSPAFSLRSDPHERNLGVKKLGEIFTEKNEDEISPYDLIFSLKGFAQDGAFRPKLQIPENRSHETDVRLHGTSRNKSFTPGICLFPNSNSALKCSKEKAQARDGACYHPGCEAEETNERGGERCGCMTLSVAHCCPCLIYGEMSVSFPTSFPRMSRSVLIAHLSPRDAPRASETDLMSVLPGKNAHVTSLWEQQSLDLATGVIPPSQTSWIHSFRRHDLWRGDSGISVSQLQRGGWVSPHVTPSRELSKLWGGCFGRAMQGCSHFFSELGVSARGALSRDRR